MTLVKWQPRNHMLWNDQSDINRLMKDMWTVRRSHYGLRDWMPSVDVEEREKEFEVSMDIPGVDKKDVKVSLENKVLTIKGERKVERNEEEDSKYHCTERRYGSFQRSLTRPKSIDSKKIRATHENGVLTITVPKAEEAREREIEIEVK